MSFARLLPPSIDRSQIVATVGLVSDTHMPMRRRALPANIGDVLGGVDILLHAGDVGELWVLDQLSAIAPVIAVHGNDDTEDAQRELPYQQLITVAGQRILLWHSHFPDWNEEMASRVHNDLRRSIQRSTDRGHRAGANIVIFGHWHIPLVHRAEDLLIVSPGALASGNEFSRMLINSVAILFLTLNGDAHVVHINLAEPEKAFVPQIDWDAGFTAVGNQYARSILAPELVPVVHYLREHFTMPEIHAVRPLIAAKAMPIWEREGGELTLADLEEALLDTTTLPPQLQDRVREVWHAWKVSTR